MRHAVVVTAAGSSCRFNQNSDKSGKKEFVSIEGHSVLFRAVQPFTEIDGLCAVVVTYAEGLENETEKTLEDLPDKVPFFFVKGGETRQQSVFNALQFLLEKNLGIEFVSIHDGARPFADKKLIAFTLAAAMVHGAAAPALAENDTLVTKDEDGFISGRLDRKGVCRIQTPQVFAFPDILEAHMSAVSSGKQYTDDTEIFNDFGRDVYLVEGSENNRKITYRKDLC